MEIQRVPSFVTLPSRAWPAGAQHWGYGHGSGRPPGFGDFVPGGYPLPWNVITMAGLQDFVPASWPLPQNPIAGYADSQGSLPKAPPLPMALIGAKNGKEAGLDCGCGCGGSCSGCSGLGTLTGDTLIPQASLPAFLQGDSYIAGFPTIYLAGAVAVTLAFMMMAGKKGRR